jgi:hypothetical protein
VDDTGVLTSEAVPAAATFNAVLLLELLVERAGRELAPATARSMVHAPAVAHGLVPALMTLALLPAHPSLPPDAPALQTTAAVAILVSVQRALVPGFASALAATPRGFWPLLLRLYVHGPGPGPCTDAH